MPRHKNVTSFVRNNPQIIGPKSEEFKKYLSSLFKNRIIIIEVFGNYWHNKLKVKIKDITKYFRLLFLGWKRIVLWEKYIKNNIDSSICLKIKRKERRYKRALS